MPSMANAYPSQQYGQQMPGMMPQQQYQQIGTQQQQYPMENKGSAGGLVMQPPQMTPMSQP